MKNKMKALSTVLLALIMIFAMSISTFAADSGVHTGSEESFTIDKEIIVYNDEDITVYGPGITYEYSIAPVETSGKTVTDKDGDTATVKPGITDGVTLTDNKAEFSKNASVVLESGKKSITDTIGVSIDKNKFSSAGIYRYAITETVESATLTTAGITRADGYADVRYLDVYLKNGNDGLEIAGYVLFIKEDETINGSDPSKNKITGKTTGFVETYDPDIDDQEPSAGQEEIGMADKYYTYNYTLTKTVAGAMGDKANYFPFAIATSGAVAGQKFTATATEGNTNFENGVASSDNTAAIGTDIKAKLKHGQTVTIKGLPANTKIQVTETNNTEDTYKVKADDTTAGSLYTEASVEKSGTAATEAKDVSTYASNKTSEPNASLKATTFTNTLNEVSPTNVVMRYAPYLFILGAGIMLLMVSRRRKAEQE